MKPSDNSKNTFWQTSLWSNNKNCCHFCSMGSLMKHFHILPSLVIFTLPARPSSAFYRWRNWGSTRQEAFLSPRQEGERGQDLVPAEGWIPDPAHNSPEGRRVSTWGHPTGPCAWSPGPAQGGSHPGCPESLSRVWLFATPWTAAHKAFLSIINPRSLLKLKSIESVMPSNHLILCCPLLLPPSIFPSIRVFSNESALSIRWPKYWSFSFSISPSNEY